MASNEMKIKFLFTIFARLYILLERVINTAHAKLDTSGRKEIAYDVRR